MYIVNLTKEDDTFSIPNMNGISICTIQKVTSINPTDFLEANEIKLSIVKDGQPVSIYEHLPMNLVINQHSKSQSVGVLDLVIKGYKELEVIIKSENDFEIEVQYKLE